MADISASTWSETDASNNAAPPAGAPEGWAPSSVNDWGRACMGATKRFYNHINATQVSGGSANAQTLAYSEAPAAYVTGDAYTFIAGFSNTGATTLNVNGLGAKNVQVGSSALAGGEILSGQVVSVYYDGTQFQLLANAAVVGPFGSILNETGATVDVVNTISGNIFSFTVPANTLGTTRKLRFVGLCDYLNNTGSSENLQLTAQYGASTILNTGNVSMATGTNRRSFSIIIEIGANGATNSQFTLTRINRGADVGDSSGASQVAATLQSGVASTEDSTVSKTFQVSATHQTSSASLSFRLHHGIVELR